MRITTSSYSGGAGRCHFKAVTEETQQQNVNGCGVRRGKGGRGKGKESRADIWIQDAGEGRELGGERQEVGGPGGRQMEE